MNKELPKLGIHENMPFDEYLNSPGMSKHALDIIHKSPATYFFQRKNPKPPTPAMVFGSALHSLVLEPDNFDKEYIKDEYSGSISKEAKEYRAELIAKGITPISTKCAESKGAWGMSDWDKLRMMRDSIFNNDIAKALLTDTQTELSMYWINKQTNKLCKGRVDAYNEAHRLLIDLKTATDASYSGFARSVHDYRYDVQDAWYSDGARLCDLSVAGFVFIAVEKEPPFLTACYTLQQSWRDIGRQKYRRDLDKWLECLETDQWPGYDEMRDLDMPAFANFNKIS